MASLRKRVSLTIPPSFLKTFTATERGTLGTRHGSDGAQLSLIYLGVRFPFLSPVACATSKLRRPKLRRLHVIDRVGRAVEEFKHSILPHMLARRSVGMLAVYGSAT